jgi:phosphocarrier protein
MIIEKHIVIKNEHGLHARPASDIVRMTQKYKSDIFLYKKKDVSKKADCKSVLSILLLGANKGTELVLKCCGQDAKNACSELLGYIEFELD